MIYLRPHYASCFTTVELRILTMRPRFAIVLVWFRPVVPRHVPNAVFLMNRDELELIGMSDTPIHPECPRVATITPTSPQI